jgi:hypothetical protein
VVGVFFLIKKIVQIFPKIGKFSQVTIKKMKIFPIFPNFLVGKMTIFGFKKPLSH